MTYEEATNRLLEIARANGGLVTAGIVETDAELQRERETVSAAAHALASSTNVFATPNDEGWFPYDEIRFTLL